jgi:hypothetical protein
VTRAEEWIGGWAKAWIEGVILTECAGNSDMKEPEHPRGSTHSWSPSPFNDFRSDASPVKRIPEAEASSILGRKSGSQRRSEVPGRDEGSGIRSSEETVSPRRNGMAVGARVKRNTRRRERRDKTLLTCQTTTSRIDRGRRPIPGSELDTSGSDHRHATVAETWCS